MTDYSVSRLLCVHGRIKNGFAKAFLSCLLTLFKHPRLELDTHGSAAYVLRCNAATHSADYNVYVTLLNSQPRPEGREFKSTGFKHYIKSLVQARAVAKDTTDHIVVPENSTFIVAQAHFATEDAFDPSSGPFGALECLTELDS